MLVTSNISSVSCISLLEFLRIISSTNSS
jgi:hypothetical protein